MSFFGQDAVRRDEERLRKQQEYAQELKQQMAEDRRRREGDMVTDDPTTRAPLGRPPLGAGPPAAGPAAGPNRGRRSTPPDRASRDDPPRRPQRTHSADSFRLPAVDKRGPHDEFGGRPLSREGEKMFQTSFKESARVEEARRLANDSQAQIKVLEDRILGENRARFQLEELVKTQLMETNILMTEMHRRMDVLEKTVQSDTSRLQQVVEKIHQMERQRSEEAQVYEQRSLTELSKIQQEIQAHDAHKRDEDAQRFAQITEECRKLAGQLELAQTEAAHFQLEARNRMQDADTALKSLSGVDDRVMERVTDKVLKLLNSTDERFKDVEQVVTVLKNQLLTEEEARQAHMKRLVSDFQEMLQEKESDIITRISQGTLSMQEQQVKSLMESRHKEFVAHRERDLAEKKALQARMDKLDGALVDAHKATQNAIDGERAVAEGIRAALEQQIGVLTSALSEEEDIRTKNDTQTRQEFVEGMKTVSKSLSLVEQDVAATRDALEQSLKAEVKSRIQGEQELKLKIEYIGGHATSHIESIEKDVKEMVENQRAIVTEVVREERKTIDEQYARSYADLAVQLKQQKKKLKETHAETEAKIEEMQSARDADKLEQAQARAETEAVLQTHTTKIGAVAAAQEEAAAARQRLSDGYDTLKKSTEELSTQMEEVFNDLTEARATIDQVQLDQDAQNVAIEAVTGKADGLRTEFVTFKEAIDETTELHWKRIEDLKKDAATIRSDVSKDVKVLTDNVSEHLRNQQAAVSELKEQLGNDWDDYKKATNDIVDDVRADLDAHRDLITEEFARLSEATNTGVEAATAAVNELREGHDSLGNDFDAFQEEASDALDGLREDIDAHKEASTKAIAAGKHEAIDAVRKEAKLRLDTDNQIKQKLEILQTASEDAAKQQASSLIQISMDLKSDLGAHKQSIEEVLERNRQEADERLGEYQEEQRGILDEISEQVEEVGKAHDDLVQDFSENKDAVDVALQAGEEEAKRISEQVGDMQGAVAASEKSLRKAMDDVRTSTAEVVDSVRDVLETFKNETQEVQEATIQDITAIKEGLQADVARQGKDLQSQGETLARIEGEIGAFDNTLKEFVGDVDTKTAQLRSALDDFQEEIRDELDAQQQSVDDNLETLQGQIDAQGEDLGVDLDELNGVIEEARAFAEQAVEELTAKTDAAAAEATRRIEGAEEKIEALTKDADEGKVMATATSQSCLQLAKRLDDAEAATKALGSKSDVDEVRKEVSTLQEKYMSGQAAMQSSLETFTNTSRDALETLQREHRKELAELHETSQNLQSGVLADVEKIREGLVASQAQLRDDLAKLAAVDEELRLEVDAVRSELGSSVANAVKELGSLEGRVSRAANDAQSNAVDELKEYYGRHAATLEKVILRCEALAKKQDAINRDLESGDIGKSGGNTSRSRAAAFDDVRTELAVYADAVGEVKSDFNFFKGMSEEAIASLRQQVDAVSKAVSDMDASAAGAAVLAPTPAATPGPRAAETPGKTPEPFMPTLIAAELESMRSAQTTFEKQVTDLEREHKAAMDNARDVTALTGEVDALQQKLGEVAAALEASKKQGGGEDVLAATREAQEKLEEKLRADMDDVRARAIAAEKLYDTLSRRQDEMADRIESGGGQPAEPLSARSTNTAADALKHAHREFEKQLALLEAKQTELAKTFEENRSSGGAADSGMAIATLAEELAELRGKVEGRRASGAESREPINDDVQAVLADLQAKYEELEKRGPVAEGAAPAPAGDVQAELDDLKAKYEELEKRAPADVSDYGAMQEEMADLKAKYEELEKRGPVAEGGAPAPAGDVQAELDDLKAKYEELEKRGPVAEGGAPAPAGDVQAELDDLKAKYEELEKRAPADVSDYGAMQEEMADLKAKYEELEKRGPVAEGGAPTPAPAGDVQTELDDLKTKVEELEKRRPASGEAPVPAGDVQAEISDLKAKIEEVAALQEELGELKAKVDGLEGSRSGAGEGDASGAGLGELQAKVEELEKLVDERMPVSARSRKSAQSKAASEGDAKSEGAKSEGAKSESAKSEGAKSEGDEDAIKEGDEALTTEWVNEQLGAMEADLGERLEQLTERIEEVAEAATVAGNTADADAMTNLNTRINEVESRYAELDELTGRVAELETKAPRASKAATPGADEDKPKEQDPMSLQTSAAANEIAIRTHGQMIDDVLGKLEDLSGRVEALAKQGGAGVGDGSGPPVDADKFDARVQQLAQEIQMANDSTDNLYDFMENNQKNTDEQLTELKEVAIVLEDRVEELLERVADTESWIRQADGEEPLPEGEGEGDEGDAGEDGDAEGDGEGDEGDDGEEYEDAPLADAPEDEGEYEDSPDAPAEES